MHEVSAWGRSGTSFPFGCRRTSGTGSLTVEPVIRWFHGPATAIFLIRWLPAEIQLCARLELGGEVFSHGREGFAAAQTEASTMIDVGGYYHFKHHPGEQFPVLLRPLGRGQTENYAYVGMYWTWGGDGINRTPAWLSSVVHLNDKPPTIAVPRRRVRQRLHQASRDRGRPAAGVAICARGGRRRALLRVRLHDDAQRKLLQVRELGGGTSGCSQGGARPD